MRRAAASSELEKLRGSTRLPEHPTGRLVGGVRTRPKRGGSPPSEATSTSHWCPDAVKANLQEWTCPHCGKWFDWSDDRQQWEPRG